MAEMNFNQGMAFLHREQAKTIAAEMPKASATAPGEAWKRVINTTKPGTVVAQAALHDPRMGAGVTAHANWMRAIKAQV